MEYLQINENMNADDIYKKFFTKDDEIQKRTEPEFIPISSYKNSILEIHKMLEDIKLLKNNMSISELSNNTWKESMKCYLDLKQNIEKSLDSVENNILQNEQKFSKQYERRILKRKRKKQSLQLQKEYTKQRRKMLDLCIDKCMKANKDKVELQKQNEISRRNADIILSDIRSRRTDCRKFTTVLKELEVLRKAKINLAKGVANSIDSEEAHKIFHDNILEVKKQWEQLEGIYQSEEKVLKSKIKSENTEFSENSKNNHFNWETGLFGMRLLGTNYGDYNWTTMKTTRKAWDSFISYTDGFEMPTGWVMPCEPSNPAWIKYTEINLSHQ